MLYHRSTLEKEQFMEITVYVNFWAQLYISSSKYFTIRGFCSIPDLQLKSCLERHTQPNLE